MSSDMENEDIAQFYDYFTFWNIVIFFSIVLLGFIFKNKIPLWIFKSVSSQVCSVFIIGTFIFTYNSTIYKFDNTSKIIIYDFYIHVLPFIFLVLFYNRLKTNYSGKFNNNLSILLNAIISSIYLLIYKIEEVYNFSNINMFIVCFLYMSTLFSSYQLFT